MTWRRQDGSLQEKLLMELEELLENQLLRRRLKNGEKRVKRKGFSGLELINELKLMQSFPRVFKFIVKQKHL